MLRAIASPTSPAGKMATAGEVPVPAVIDDSSPSFHDRLKMFGGSARPTRKVSSLRMVPSPAKHQTASTSHPDIRLPAVVVEPDDDVRDVVEDVARDTSATNQQPQVWDFGASFSFDEMNDEQPALLSSSSSSDRSFSKPNQNTNATMAERSLLFPDERKEDDAQSVQNNAISLHSSKDAHKTQSPPLFIKKAVARRLSYKKDFDLHGHEQKCDSPSSRRTHSSPQFSRRDFSSPLKAILPKPQPHHAVVSPPQIQETSDCYQEQGIKSPSARRQETLDNPNGFIERIADSPPPQIQSSVCYSPLVVEQRAKESPTQTRLVPHPFETQSPSSTNRTRRESFHHDSTIITEQNKMSYAPQIPEPSCCDPEEPFDEPSTGWESPFDDSMSNDSTIVAAPALSLQQSSLEQWAAETSELPPALLKSARGSRAMEDDRRHMIELERRRSLSPRTAEELGNGGSLTFSLPSRKSPRTLISRTHTARVTGTQTEDNEEENEELARLAMSGPSSSPIGRLSPAVTIMKVIQNQHPVCQQQAEAVQGLADTPPRVAARPQTETSNIPESHIQVIRHVFGLDCDLYRDVLLVDSGHATDRQIRVAYFRRGREVLAEAKERDKGLTTDAKARFHAVSLAYEIVSCPEWRRSYDKFGWNQPAKKKDEKVGAGVIYAEDEPEDVLSVKSTQTTVTSILRPPGRSCGLKCLASPGRSIRWSEEVEELLYCDDPQESKEKIKAARKARKARKEFKEEALASLRELEKVDKTRQGKTSKSKTIVDVTPEMKDMERRAFESTFMDMLLSDLESSLDGLEESLDGMMTGRKPQNTATKGTSNPYAYEEDDASSILSTGSSSNRAPEASSFHAPSGDNHAQEYAVNAAARQLPGKGQIHLKLTPDPLSTAKNAAIGKGIEDETQRDKENKQNFGEITADRAFSYLGPLMKDRSTRRLVSPPPPSSAFDGDGWNLTLSPIHPSSRRERSQKFDDVFDPFADESFSSHPELTRHFQTGEEIKSAGNRPLVPSRPREELYSPECSDDSMSFSDIAPVIYPVNISVSTDTLENCTPCQFNRGSPSYSKREFEDVVANEEIRQSQSNIGAGAGDASAATQESKDRAAPPATNIGEKAFFSNLVTYMERVSTDLSAFGSQMSAGANKMVNGVAETFLLDDGGVDKLIYAVGAGMNGDDTVNPAVERSFSI